MTAFPYAGADLALFAIAVLLVGAVACAFVRSWRVGGVLATAFAAVAAACAWAGAWPVLLGGVRSYGFGVAVPGFRGLAGLALDPVGAGFLVLVTGISLAGAWYSAGYMRLYERESPARFYALLLLFVAGMAGVAAAGDWLAFLVAWEAMTLASYFLVVFERGNPEALRAGFKYFVMNHVATAGMLAAIVFLAQRAGSFEFGAQRAALLALDPLSRQVVVGLFLLAFATKAGVYPMGDWLPDAHPAAPTGVSAILSGVMIKLGALGALRVLWSAPGGVLPPGEAYGWGVALVVLGLGSALIGGLAAMQENDCKRLLAYSSMSQAGLIFLGLGVALAFSGRPETAALSRLGLLGAVFHVLNDALYKALLFMGAGTMAYSTGTRDLDRAGGLARVAPLAAAAALVGALSLAGLPLTNGFASKWVLYQALLGGALSQAPFALAVVAAFFLGLVTLAYALKLFATAYLGSVPAGAANRPAPLSMTLPQAALGVACLVGGLAPLPLLRVTGVMAGGGPLPLAAGAFGNLAASAGTPAGAAFTPLGVLLFLAVVAGLADGGRRLARGGARPVAAWLGGEEHPADEVRYRARGFYGPFRLAFARAYPALRAPRLPALGGARRVLDLDAWLYGPAVKAFRAACGRLSRLHGGVPQLYVAWQVCGALAVVCLLAVLLR